ncbi:leucine-rich repeat receptor-like serine/threonine/tyrosine-protein kinase SOBIR1 [Ziziphus jujuba]|uniref:Leucine-rich repeat receptor-like serine/threonine/tyrosine-protein kinase SOBIR1 n=1 Tax=Ziziphus jujuba TaxID=326968 RepID=A0A6P4A2Y6_ZIZJJ|nr:leucine-rich repeat receptor-like serine/threonine/tyrosine-protein kinase SOBIR1 [Ziziphus jujuba]
MAAFPGKTHLLFFFFTFLSLFFFIHARPSLDPSDLKALSIIQKDLGINGQRRASFTAPCNIPGVFCERRLSENNTYVLKITRLILNSQRLTGSLSPEIGKLSELKELSLSNNNLVDQIPSQILDCRKMEILNLGNNKFSGEVPSRLSSLIRLRVLDLSSNKFSGNLSFLKHFPNLEKLSIAENLFTGKIPASIRSFRNLRFFNFSGNQFLEGSMPSMKRLEYSTSEVPKRYILAESPTSGRNRSSAAAAPSKSNSTSAEAPGPSTPKTHKKKENKKKLIGWILGFLAGAVAGTISGFVFSLLFKLILAAVMGGGMDKGPAIFSPLIKKKEDLAFLEKEEGLASLEKIGQGGCGEVYKAELPGSNGKLIAIKKIIQPPKDAAELTEEDSKTLNKKMRQIRSEINTVGHIRHRNLLPLLAHVSRPDCHYLVYEFMKNGSLQDRFGNVEAAVQELDWLARVKIALGVASGLEYLHMNHNPRIIHRDLKPANILLDDDMEARIADFGLAKAMPDAHTHITSSNVAGTVGYIAPEYHQTLKFTDKCDIYSFGVILAVLVTGKLPSDEFFQNGNEIGLVKWLRSVISESPREAIDPKLMGNGFEEQMLLVLKVAYFCTLDNPKERPNSKDVRCMLSQIKH